MVTWQPPAKTRAAFDIYRAERTATQIIERRALQAVVLALITYRRAVLGWGWITDHARRTK